MTTTAPARARGLAVWFVVPALVFVDLVAKVWARSVSADVPLGFSNLFLGFRLIENTGVSFGALTFEEGAGELLPLALTTALVVVVGIWMIRSQSEWQRLFVGMLFAGGLSNVIDRLLSGAVTDFIEYRWFGQTLFIGNLADVWIFIGVVGAFVPLLLVPRRQSSTGTQETEGSR